MHSSPRSSAYLRANENSSHWTASAVAVEPSAITIGFDMVRSSATSCMASTGSAMARLRLPVMSSSIMASTRAVVPTLRNVATSARLASPTMTCSRR